MAELAPQSADGSYVRPSYGFRGQLGTADFPLEEGRYHMYVRRRETARRAREARRVLTVQCGGVLAMWATLARGATA